MSVKAKGVSLSSLPRRHGKSMAAEIIQQMSQMPADQLRLVRDHAAAKLEVAKDEVGTKEDVRVLLDAAKYEATRAMGHVVYSAQSMKALTPLARIAAESVALVVDTVLPSLTRVERLAAFKWVTECARLSMRERGAKSITVETLLRQLQQDPYRVIEDSYPGYLRRGLVETIFKNYCRIKIKPTDREE